MGRLLPLMVALALVVAPCVGAPVDGARAEEAARRWLELTPRPMGQQAGAPGHATTYADGAGVIRFHVVSLSHSGFVVVAADDEVEPILAFSCDGEFVAQAGNPLYDLLLCDTDVRPRSATIFQAGRRGAVGRKNAKWQLLSAAAVRGAAESGA